MNHEPSSVEAVRVPYTGLRPFEPHEAALFFGRSDQIERMLARLETNRFLAVVGGSGCGKSSLVRAGLLPALADGFLMGSGDDWRFVIARPGDDAFESLAQALITAVDGPKLTSPTGRSTEGLASSDPFHLALVENALRSSRGGLVDALAQCEVPATSTVLVLIDQFEELFRFRNLVRCDKSADTYQTRNEAMAFVELLLQSVTQTDRRVLVVVTMRSEFMGDCDAFPGLPEAISDSQFLAPRMTRPQLAEAIAGPLEACGDTMEPGFVNRVLNDVGSNPDQLPLMQHALLRTWQRAREQASNETSESSDLRVTRLKSDTVAAPTELLITHYEDVGGVSGALNQHADQIFDALGDATSRTRLQRVAERLFCSLSEQRDGGPLTRRPITVALAALEAGATEEDVQTVSQAFQEANLLIFSPPGQRLGPKTRLDISHESLFRQWNRLQFCIDRETKSALNYRRLMDAVRSNEPSLSDTQLAQAQEWLQKAQPNVNWAMRYDGTLEPYDSLFPRCRALVEFSHQARLSRLANEQAAVERAHEQLLDRQKAAEQAKRAHEAEATAIRFRRLTSVALGACVFAIVCLTFALWNLSDATKSRELAQQQQANANRENANHYSRLAVNFSVGQAIPDVVKAAHLFLRGARSLDLIVAAQKSPTDLKLGEKDKIAAHAVDQSVVQTWVHDLAVLGCQFTRDESHVLTWSADNTVRFWDVANTKPLQTFKHDNNVEGAQFNSNDSRVLTWSADNTARLWDVTKSEPIGIFQHDNVVQGAQFNRDDSRVLTWGGDSHGKKGEARLWDVNNPEPIQIFIHDDAVQGAQLSNDDSRVLTWSGSNATLWDVALPDSIQTYKHDGFVRSAQFSPDELLVLTSSDDMTARLWDVDKPDPILTFVHDGFVRGGLFSMDESYVLTWSDDKTVRMWDVTKPDPDPIQTFKHDVYIRGVLFCRDNSRVLTWGGDPRANKGEARLWDVTKPASLQTFKHDSVVNGAQFSPDESQVLTWSDDKTARVWNVFKPEPLQTFKHDRAVKGAQFNRDASQVLSWSTDNTARLWGIIKPKLSLIFRDDIKLNTAQFNRDASRLMTWSDDQTARLWDVTKDEPIRIFARDEKGLGLEFSPDASRMLTLSSDGFARLWDITKPEPIRTFSHDGTVWGVEFGHDESHVLTWSQDGTACLWEVAKPDPITKLKFDSSVEGVEFNDDHSRLLTWNGDNTTKLWDVTGAKEIGTFKHDNSVNGARFSHNGSYVLTWSDDNLAKLWDVSRPEPIRNFKHDDSVVGAQFNRNESRLLTWSHDNTAKLWDVSLPEPILTFQLDSALFSAEFSHDELHVLTVNESGVQVWDISDPLAELVTAERILELEIRSGVTLDEQLNLQTLKYEVWQAKLKSPEYRAIAEKLAKHKSKQAQAAQ